MFAPGGGGGGAEAFIGSTTFVQVGVGGGGGPTAHTADRLCKAEWTLESGGLFARHLPFKDKFFGFFSDSDNCSLLRCAGELSSPFSIDEARNWRRCVGSCRCRFV